MGKMQGLNFSSLKKHPALLPLFLCVGFGAAISTCYTMRLAVRNPDVSWAPQGNPEPWNEYKNKQYKFVGEKPPPSQAPEY